MKRILIVILLFLAVRGSAFAKFECDVLHIPIYETEATPQPYFIIGKAYIPHHNFVKLNCEMRKQAIKYKGDAVVQYKFERTDEMLEINSQDHIVTNFLANGIIVRWAKDGEKNAAETSKNISIPILE